MQGNDYSNKHLLNTLHILRQERVDDSPRVSLFDVLKSDIAKRKEMEGNYKARLHRRLDVLSDMSVNMLVVGEKGAGKSATIDALFGGSHGSTLSSSTSESGLVRKTLNQLSVWQAPLPTYGENNTRLEGELASLLSEHDQNNQPLIDVVMVLLDASSTNLDDAYLDICHTIVPMLGAHRQRIMVLFNKADKVASAIRGTRVDEVMPLDAEVWLDCTAATMRYRLIHNTGIFTKPVAYSALGQHSPTGRPYNLLKLLARTMATLPEEKRLTLLNQPISIGDDVWRDHDDRLMYLQSIENLCFDTLHIGAYEGDRFGGQLGAFLGLQGRALGDRLTDHIRERLGITV